MIDLAAIFSPGQHGVLARKCQIDIRDSCFHPVLFRSQWKDRQALSYKQTDTPTYHSIWVYGVHVDASPEADLRWLIRITRAAVDADAVNSVFKRRL